MKRIIFSLAVLTLASEALWAGPQFSAKEMKQTSPPPCPEWYGDNEWNVSLWGTYAFTGTEYAPNLDLVDLIVSTTEGETVFGTFDRYVGRDHAWGGGADLKYFFYRYFGVGIQGFVLDATRQGFDIEVSPLDGIEILESRYDRRAIGSVLGTFTLRYPVPCTRYAPYAWGGVGAIFGGGEREKLTTEEIGGGGGVQPQQAPFVNATTQHFGSETEVMGQFGAGLEVRFTRHIGWTTDFSWNVINGPKNNFGMARTGLNFAF